MIDDIKYEMNDAFLIEKSTEKIVFIREKKKISIEYSFDLEQTIIRYIKNGYQPKLDGTNDFSEFLISQKILIPIFSKKYEEKSFQESTFNYVAQISDNPSKVMRDMTELTIAILGVGGVGQVILEQFAAIGFVKFILIDYDFVNLKNLNRQFLINKKDDGKKKTNSVKKNLEKRFSLDIIIYDCKIKEEEDLKSILLKNKVDFMVCAADQPIDVIQDIVRDLCSVYNIPCGFCSVGFEYATIGPILSRNARKMFKTNKVLSENLLFRNILSASISFTNSIAATIFTKEIFEFLIFGKTVLENQVMLYDFNKYKGKMINE
ncbi:hypothetical protein FACS1894192_03450 [Bacilli bacterium]|nr:hypothetical protein FACS1894192_03450 [Bacilli bacterium]